MTSSPAGSLPDCLKGTRYAKKEPPHGAALFVSGCLLEGLRVFKKTRDILRLNQARRTNIYWCDIGFVANLQWVRQCVRGDKVLDKIRPLTLNVSHLSTKHRLMQSSGGADLWRAKPA